MKIQRGGAIRVYRVDRIYRVYRVQDLGRLHVFLCGEPGRESISWRVGIP